jgi:hypothetical protein
MILITAPSNGNYIWVVKDPADARAIALKTGFPTIEQAKDDGLGFILMLKEEQDSCNPTHTTTTMSPSKMSQSLSQPSAA